MEHHINNRRSYGGIQVDGNATATTILNTEVWTKFALFAVSLPSHETVADPTNDRLIAGSADDFDVEFFAEGFSAGVNKVFEIDLFRLSHEELVITAMTAADPIVVESVGHGKANGSRLKLSDITGMVEANDQVFVLANVAADTFELNDESGGDIDGSLYTPYVSGGIAQVATRTLAHTDQKWIGGSAEESVAGGSIAAFEAEDLLELMILNGTDDTDFTMEGVVMKMGLA
jgi:hypothetical protein